MVRLKWSKTHEVFLPEIDGEHRTLFRLTEDYQQAILTKENQEHVDAALRYLLAACEEHFQHEERMMAETQYPSMQWHKQQHDTVRKRCAEILDRIAAGDSKAPHELVRFVANWLKDHTAVADRMMGAHLRNRERFLTRPLPRPRGRPRIHEPQATAAT
jgi:hemerythrin